MGSGGGLEQAIQPRVTLASASPDLVDDVKQNLVCGYVGHRRSIVREADQPFPINCSHERHAPQFEQADLLLVTLGDFVVWIRHADKWKSLAPPIAIERVCRVRPHSQNFRPTTGKLLIVIPESRQLRAAVGSKKPA